ncbi:MAG TPA: ribonuclease P protein component [Tepidisphaeraceae bacterium]|nr:ribonuclease P protein component [Tepidisphaeraceae bacterium]
MPSPPPRHRFRKFRRLGGRDSFAAIRADGRRIARGPLVFFVLANPVGYTRIGISIGRHAGNAVRRNRIKRLIREAFRLSQHELPAGVDVVISVKAHAPLTLAAYKGLLMGAGWGLE